MKAALYGLVGTVAGLGFIAIAVNAFLAHALADVFPGRLHP